MAVILSSKWQGRPTSLEFELSRIWWRGRLNGHVAPQPSPDKVTRLMQNGRSSCVARGSRGAP